MTPDCEWTLDLEDWNGWRASCSGDLFVLNDGGPVENQMAFCCYCGGKLIEVRQTAEDEDECFEEAKARA